MISGKTGCNLDKKQENGVPEKWENRNMKRWAGFISFRYFTFASICAKDREYRGEIMYRREVLWNPTPRLPASLSS